MYRTRSWFTLSLLSCLGVAFSMTTLPGKAQAQGFSMPSFGGGMIRIPGGGGDRDFGPRPMMRDRGNGRGGGFGGPPRGLRGGPGERRGGFTREGPGRGDLGTLAKPDRGVVDKPRLPRSGRELGDVPGRLKRPNREITTNPKRIPRPGDVDVSRLPKPGRGDSDVSRLPKPGRDDVDVSRLPKPGRGDIDVSRLPKPGRNDVDVSRLPKPGRGDSDVSRLPKPGRDDVDVSRLPKPGRGEIDVSRLPRPGGRDDVGDGRPYPGGTSDGPPLNPDGRPRPPQTGDSRPYPDGKPGQPGSDDGRPYPENRPDRPRRPRLPPVIVINPFPVIPPPPVVYIDPEPPLPYDDYAPEPPVVADGPTEPDRPRREEPRRQARTPAAPPPGGTPPTAFTAASAPLPYRRDFALSEQPLFRPAEILVMVQSPEPDTVATGLAQSFNLVLEESQSFVLLENSRLYRFSIPDNRTVESLTAAVSTAPGVGLASPNFYHYLQGGTGQNTLSMQYALPKLRVPDTQELVSGRGITVAVIDSGVDVDHPVFQQANVTVYDAVDGGIKGPDQHGTAIAGIIAGRGEISGIAPGARILAVRAFAPERLGAAPSTTSMTLARATDTAFARGARVFNMSFAGPRDPLLLSLIDKAHEKGSIFVAAAGNQGPKAPPAYPAAYEKVIAITATDEADAIYTQANRGDYVAVAAPGVDIFAPVADKAFDYLSGTSFAAAHISGIIALLMERNPRLTPEDVQEVLREAAIDLGEKGPDADFGDGLADAYGALILASPVIQSSFSR